MDLWGNCGPSATLQMTGASPCGHALVNLLDSATGASVGAKRGCYRIKLLAKCLSLPLLSLLLVGVSQAEVVFDAEAYRQLADASSRETLAPGTAITVRNWTKYKAFIPVGLQIAYGGKYPIRISAGAEFTIEVSPTNHFSSPAKYLEDTAKTSGKSNSSSVPGAGIPCHPYRANWLACRLAPTLPSPTSDTRSCTIHGCPTGPGSLIT
jgi:hypothetical protein